MRIAFFTADLNNSLPEPQELKKEFQLSLLIMVAAILLSHINLMC